MSVIPARWLVAALALLGPVEVMAQDDVPPGLQPLAPLIGSWKGQAVPSANRVRGWTETHRWSWAFTDSKPVAAKVAMTGSKLLSEGTVTFDDAANSYRLEAKGPAGEGLVFVGKIDARTKGLTLERTPAPKDGPERIVLFAKPDSVRYEMKVERKPRGAPQYKPAIEMNLGREGESFAAGSKADALPTCVVTGGSASMTVTHEGKSYPLCCTGCRDEFLANPAKYIAKIEARSKEKGGKPSAPAAKPSDDPFADDLPAAPESKRSPGSRKSGQD